MPVMVAEVGMSSMADEEELCVWFVSTDITVTTTVAKERERTEGKRIAGRTTRATRNDDVSSDQGTALGVTLPQIPHPVLTLILPLRPNTGNTFSHVSV